MTQKSLRMKQQKRMRNKSRRPGRRRASFSQRKPWMRALAILMALCLLAVPTLYLAGTQKEIEQEEPPEPLEITIPEPCTTGTVTVYAQDQVIYQYGGEISIRNDGKNGEEIEIVVEYPERSWPCSCFYYEEE